MKHLQLVVRVKTHPHFEITTATARKFKRAQCWKMKENCASQFAVKTGTFTATAFAFFHCFPNKIVEGKKGSWKLQNTFWKFKAADSIIPLISVACINIHRFQIILKHQKIGDKTEQKVEKGCWLICFQNNAKRRANQETNKRKPKQSINALCLQKFLLTQIRRPFRQLQCPKRCKTQFKKFWQLWSQCHDDSEICLSEIEKF